MRWNHDRQYKNIIYKTAARVCVDMLPYIQFTFIIFSELGL